MAGVVVVVLVGLRRGVAGCGLRCDCPPILEWAGGRRDLAVDVDVDEDVDAGTVRLRAVDGDPGRPGSATEPLSMALQSIQASRCCDQARAS